MNRRKKIKNILTKKAKQANLKANPKNKPKYISKAERAKLEAEKVEAGLETTEQTDAQLNQEAAN